MWLPTCLSTVQEIQSVSSNLQALRVAHSRFVSSKNVVSAIGPEDAGEFVVAVVVVLAGRAERVVLVRTHSSARLPSIL